MVPWQSLASMNQNFLLTERRRHYLRYAGGLCYFEVCRTDHPEVVIECVLSINKLLIDPLRRADCTKKSSVGCDNL